MAACEIELRLTIDTNDYLYYLWCVRAAMRACAGTPTPFHEVMHRAGLWATV